MRPRPRRRARTSTHPAPRRRAPQRPAAPAQAGDVVRELQREERQRHAGDATDPGREDELLDEGARESFPASDPSAHY